MIHLRHHVWLRRVAGKSRHTKLANLSGEVRECLQRAEQCAARAKIEPNPALQRDFIDMELRWLHLARSYRFLDQISIASAEPEKQRGELSVRLAQLKQRVALVTQERVVK